ncbi:hypothetical protein CORT_0A13320 [Candida orthopsilosis Co 90-125]|uniref:PX domain-containing protein n=1 Tax=Candida orthopsilosis (strain 90-125) TaxID=1136231 RepID=H8WXP2_CANO9|nr:hypothetical protein CORT_0A13320 [Candida orthopsilosis Co 90-125]CCG21715.1 hypothetical protein CORT_0A13320 [Candida orthopsilosis Co 90-125]
MSNEYSLFDDLEQDNNPSLYGNASILTNPYNSGTSGNNNHTNYKSNNAEQKNASSVANGKKVESEGVVNTTSSAKRTSKKEKQQHNSVATSSSSPQSTPKQPHKHSPQQPSRQQLSPISNALSDNDEYPTELVNSTLGLSNQITQLLEASDLTIDVINSERLINSSIIVYTIQLQSSILQSKIVVKRRYSEFKSLRDNLLKLFPTLIIPPIPEKHSILSYLLNSINLNNESNIIEMRRRYFKLFLDDLVFDANPKLKNCPLLHKFLDPNYELCWYNALNEPPVSYLPNNLLLANPVNPADQNGLYSILPIVNGFDISSNTDNLSNLKKINDDLDKLNDSIKLFELNGTKGDFEDDLKFTIPEELITFEGKFHKIITSLSFLNKLDIKTTKDYKSLINVLIDLGGNLNNFSLQIYHQKPHHLRQQNPSESSFTTDIPNNSLSEAIEKFGSTMDQCFLNFENFVLNQLIPQWQEPIHQLIQYNQTALNLIKFYKYKIIQFKILYKLKFNKFQQLININSLSGGRTGGANAIGKPSFTKAHSQEEEDAVVINSLDHLKELNSPTLNNALKNISMKKVQKKSSWYGLFGGNNQTKKFNFQLPVEEANGTTKATTTTTTTTVAPAAPASTIPTSSSTVQTMIPSHTSSIKFKIQHLEKELDKINQLIELCNKDMQNLTQALMTTFIEFIKKLEHKWLVIMINYIRNGKTLFEENLTTWENFKTSLENEEGDESDGVVGRILGENVLGGGGVNDDDDDDDDEYII